MSLPDSIDAARYGLGSGEFTASDLLARALEEISRTEPTVHAMVTPTFDLAQEQADRADARLRSGERSPLLGIPVVAKDLVDVRGVPTRAGSRVLAGNIATSSAPAWERLEQAGAVLLGKANTHEFAYGGTTEPTLNPADPSRIVGGSSGGPAAALAARYCLGAIGTDTAGSIRIPANLCGVAGLKPTQGTVPSQGVIPLSPTLDAVGPMARTVADLGLLLAVMSGIPQPPDREPGPRRVGVVRNTGECAAAVSAALDTFASTLHSLGVETVDVDVPRFEDAIGANFTVIGWEASAFHAQFADRRHLYTPYVRARLDDAQQITPDQLAAALAVGVALGAQVDGLLTDLDALLLPGVPLAAPPAYDERVLVGEHWEDRDTALCRNTAFANLTGHPALAVPAGLDGALPVGVQLVGRRGADFAIIELGAAVERLLTAR